MLTADNSRKTPLTPALNSLSAQRASDAVYKQKREYPCRAESADGQIVTASFQVFGQPFAGILPNIAVPIASSVYDWIPVQPGDLGVFKGADAYLGGISGQGGGQADFTPRGNTSTLYFQPLTNKAWTVPAVAAGDAAVRVMQGPHGVGLQDIGNNSSMLLNATTYHLSIDGGKVTIAITGDAVTLTVPSGKKVTITAGGTPSKVMTEAGASPVLWADGA